jgi:hypothetical protein
MYKSCEIFLAALKSEQTMGLQVRNLAAFIELNSLLVLQETALVYDFADTLLSLVIISAAVLRGLHMLPLSKHDGTGTKLCAMETQSSQFLMGLKWNYCHVCTFFLFLKQIALNCAYD